MAQDIAARLTAKHFAVTLGTKGVMLLDNEEGQTYFDPALSTKVLDRVGAGDAFLAFSAMCLGKGISPEAAVFVGSAAAALDVQIVCNKKPISSGDLLKYLGTLLK